MTYEYLAAAIGAPTPVSSTTRAELLEDLGRANVAVPDFAERMSGFLLDGVDEGILDELGALTEEERKGVFRAVYVGEPFRLVRATSLLTPELILRLAAFSHTLCRESEPGWVGLPFWLRQATFYITADVRALAAAGELTGLTRADFVELLLPHEISERARGWSEFATEERELVRKRWLELDGFGREHLIRKMDQAGVDFSTFADLLVREAVGQRKDNRLVARRVLERIEDRAESIAEVLQQGKPTERILALELYLDVADRLPADLLDEIQKGTRSRKLIQAIEATRQELQRTQEPTVAAMELPPLPPQDLTPRSPTNELKEKFFRLLDEGFEVQLANHESKRSSEPKRCPPAERERIFASLFDPEPWPEQERVPFVRQYHGVGAQLDGDLELVPLARWTHLRGSFFIGSYHPRQPWQEHAELFDLRAAAELGRYCGIPLASLGRQWLTGHRRPSQNLEKEGIWPFFAQHPEVLVDVLDDPGDYERNETLEEAAWIASILPELPAVLDRPLWNVATTGPVKVRPMARAALNGSRSLDERLLSALRDRKKSIRDAAANWIAERKPEGAADAVRAALETEKDATVCRSLTRTLHDLKEPIALEPTDRAALIDEAAKMLDQGVPTALSWLNRSRLPRLKWSDGNEVDVRLVDAWLVDATEQKVASADYGVRTHCEAMEPMSRRAFADALFDRWLELATEEAKTGPDGSKGTAERSAECRGLLGLAAAVGPSPDRVVPTAEQFLRQWNGRRMGQCRALLDFVSSIDAPNATSLLVSIAQRFRTKALQKEAIALVEGLAARRGWTRDEFVDRTLPHGDLGPNREVEIAYRSAASGEVTRRFALRLGADLKIDIREDGEKWGSLPRARRDEDPESVSEARSTLKSLRQQTKESAKLQTSRLEDALCTGREWSVPLWLEVFRDHPIGSLLAERVVWGLYREGELEHSFRPLEDRIWTDAHDDTVSVVDDTVASAAIRVAHGLDLSVEERDRWRSHFADYAVAPLLRQLEVEPYELPPERVRDRELTDFQGHLLSGERLQSTLRSLGYTSLVHGWRGRAHYATRHFRSLGIQAVIEHTGFYVDIENPPVALLRLGFFGTDDPIDLEPPRLLGSAPPRVISECYRDFETLARAGDGFDPNWQEIIR
ncbi:MAG: DUF4132 domain-containing protein [Planctomycetes bacterium]|nr:DUF4132 domain-containing protein [Planctomycetota bacterium]